MKHVKLETELKARIRKRRIWVAVWSIIFLMVIIAFSILYAQSKVVEEIGFGPIKRQSVTYNRDFTWGILVGALGLTVFAICLIADFVFSQVITFEINGDYITFYRGFLHTNLYVNGEEHDSISYGYYLEATLSDRTKVNVALGKWSAHFTFSNGHVPMDIYVMDKE